MTFVVRFRVDAQHDFNRALAYYAAEVPHETERFIDEAFTAAGRLAQFPYSSPELRRDARRANLRVFPYQLWYRVHDEAEVVEIIAVLHHRQDSARFAGRLEPGTER